MKNLWQFAMLCLVAISFVACSDDDDNGSSSAEATLVGNWTIEEISFSYEVPGFDDPVEETYNTVDLCNPTPTASFQMNGNASVSDITIDVDENDNPVCENSGDMQEGEWVKLEDNTYEIILDGFTDVAEVMFSNNNNTMTFTQMDEDGESKITFDRQ